MKLYERTIEPAIKARLTETGKVIVLYGPRQVGKTTLAKKLLADQKSEQGYFTCDELAVRDALSSGSSKRMYEFFARAPLIVLDEAQTVPDIGRALKLMIDTYPELHIIATGSSSFDLANKVSEPLTGRHYMFFLPPISFEEIVRNQSNAELITQLNTRLIYGGYPEVLNASNNDEAQRKLESLATSYLYRDVLQFGRIKNAEVLMKILRALAHQIGGEVSYNEIATAVQVDRKTVMNYIDLLEQAFIIFKLLPFSRNRRDEIKRLRKVYFFDNGIVNALTGNFTSVESGRPMGDLWENLMMAERWKYNNNHERYKHLYYWRTHQGGEVDLVEEYGGELHPYEFKWSASKAGRGARAFQETYRTDPVQVVNQGNFVEFVVE